MSAVSRAPGELNKDAASGGQRHRLAHSAWVRYGDGCPNVKAVQENLLARGYPLPKFGADGKFGPETCRALFAFCHDVGLSWDISLPVPKTVLDALTGYNSAVLEAPKLDEGVELIDLRHEQGNPHPKSKLDAQGRTVVRDPKQIDCIVLHQAGVAFGGSPPSRRYRRALNVACHAMAMRPGAVVWPVDPRWYLYHADRLNRRSLGVEVDGNYPGLVGGPVKNLHAANELDDKILRAARMAVKLLVVSGRRLGCPIRYIYAHRQTDNWRRADPGEGLWRKVVLEYAVPVLKLETRPLETFSHPKGPYRDGLVIPQRWDPAGRGPY